MICSFCYGMEERRFPTEERRAPQEEPSAFSKIKSSLGIGKVRTPEEARQQARDLITEVKKDPNHNQLESIINKALTEHNDTLAGITKAKQTSTFDRVKAVFGLAPTVPTVKEATAKHAAAQAHWQELIKGTLEAPDLKSKFKTLEIGKRFMELQPGAGQPVPATHIPPHHAPPAPPPPAVDRTNKPGTAVEPVEAVAAKPAHILPTHPVPPPPAPKRTEPATTPHRPAPAIPAEEPEKPTVKYAVPSTPLPPAPKRTAAEKEETAKKKDVEVVVGTVKTKLIGLGDSLAQEKEKAKQLKAQIAATPKVGVEFLEMMSRSTDMDTSKLQARIDGLRAQIKPQLEAAEAAAKFGRSSAEYQKAKTDLEFARRAIPGFDSDMARWTSELANKQEVKKGYEADKKRLADASVAKGDLDAATKKIAELTAERQKVVTGLDAPTIKSMEEDLKGKEATLIELNTKIEQNQKLIDAEIAKIPGIEEFNAHPQTKALTPEMQKILTRRTAISKKYNGELMTLVGKLELTIETSRTALQTIKTIRPSTESTTPPPPMPEWGAKPKPTAEAAKPAEIAATPVAAKPSTTPVAEPTAKSVEAATPTTAEETAQATTPPPPLPPANWKPKGTAETVTEEGTAKKPSQLPSGTERPDLMAEIQSGKKLRPVGKRKPAPLTQEQAEKAGLEGRSLTDILRGAFKQSGTTPAEPAATKAEANGPDEKAWTLTAATGEGAPIKAVAEEERKKAKLATPAEIEEEKSKTICRICQ